MRADIKPKLVVPAHIICTQLCPDLTLWSDLEKVVDFVELMVARKNKVEEASALKKARYSELMGCLTEACGGRQT